MEHWPITLEKDNLLTTFQEKKYKSNAPWILKYLNETIDDYELRQHIKLNHWISEVSWSANENKWYVVGQDFSMLSFALKMTTGIGTFIAGLFKNPQFNISFKAI